ncbi:MAG: M3 family metallopeptidase [Nostocoides sp.]
MSSSPPSERAVLQPLALPDPAGYGPWLTQRSTTLLQQASDDAERLKSDPPATTNGLLAAWNDIEAALGAVASAGELFCEVHPDGQVRRAAETIAQDAQRLSTRLSLDPQLYALFAAADPAGLDADTTRLLDHTLRDFRRAGVDRDEATRERVRQLNERLVELGQEFGKNIREDVRSIRISPAQLDGLPQDWIEGHPVDEDGLVTVTTDYPDLIPFRTFARSAEARKHLHTTALQVAWPDNDAVLHNIVNARAELAQTLGYADWASYDAEVKMIRSGPAIPAFIDKIAGVAEAPGRRDREVLLERLRKDRPDATAVQSYDTAYYAEVIRREQLDVDAQVVRTYLDFGKVRTGLLDVTGALFGLSYVPAPDAPVWHEDVTAYDVFENRQRIGRIYLDLHPREGKYKHAAQFDLVRGVQGKQLPEGVLVCNFPRGLMAHDDVVTLFHEFGHLVHHIVGGRQPWVRFSGVATEWDFVEAPSQMLEEWAWDPAVVRTFATNEAGEAIPAELVTRMRAADEFGQGFWVRTQMFYAAVSYVLHIERPEDITERVRQLQEEFSLFPYLSQTHFASSFGHLDGYSSGYYTYMWSLVIAKDMFSAFDSDDLFAPEVARRYRDTVLAQGGRRDAADLVEAFLGRPYTFDAYAAWLDGSAHMEN